MNIITIDTVTPVLCITASGPNGKVTCSVTTEKQHAENLVAVIDKTINLAGFTPIKTELVVCAEGPGSFTGLRLGWSSAKAIQLASSCPLIAVPPLACYADGFISWPGVVISVLDAKKLRFYVQLFRKGTAITAALDIQETDVIQYIDRTERILVTGPDAVLFSERLLLSCADLDVTTIPSGVDGISSIMTKFAENEFSGYNIKTLDHDGPIYVRKSDAETTAN